MSELQQRLVRSGERLGEEASYQLTCLPRIMVSSRIVLNYSPMDEVVCVSGCVFVSVCLCVVWLHVSNGRKWFDCLFLYILYLRSSSKI